MGFNLDIRHRLYLGFGLVIAALVVQGLMTFWQGARSGESLDVMAADMRVMEQAGEMEAQALMQAVYVRDLVANEDLKVQREVLAALKASRESYRAAAVRFAELTTARQRDEERELTGRIVALAEGTSPLVDEALALINDGRYAEVKDVVYGKLRPQQARLNAALKEYSSLKEAQGRAAALRNSEGLRNVALLSVVLTVAAAAVAVLVGFILIRGLTRRIGGAVASAEAMARGDFSVRIGSSGRDELTRLFDAFNGAVDNLAALIGKVRTAAWAVDGASREIREGNDALASRTEAQAARLEQTAATVEQITSAVKQNADNAKSANTLADEAASAGSQGRQLMEELQAQMQSIAEASKRISDITGIIDSIAFQTNILALNAAVEAARAGEHGHGFAVVAAEVRALAQRSGAAAKEIKSQIDDSLVKVEAGLDRVDRTGETMAHVADLSQRLNLLVNQITSASREQAVGIDQVNKTIVELESTTQHNAALVGQAAAASAKLSDQASQLGDAVQVFRLGGENIGDLPAGTAIAKL